MNLPLAYHHFAQSKVPNPPFIIYYCPSENHFAADGLIYYKTKNMIIELYSDKKDLELESRLERFLETEYYYDKSEIWIETERLYLIRYELEV